MCPLTHLCLCELFYIDEVGGLDSRLCMWLKHFKYQDYYYIHKEPI